MAQRDKSDSELQYLAHNYLKKKKNFRSKWYMQLMKLTGGICEWIHDDYECLYSVGRVGFINYASAVKRKKIWNHI